MIAWVKKLGKHREKAGIILEPMVFRRGHLGDEGIH
jgi:hypothetical protein